MNLRLSFSYNHCTEQKLLDAEIEASVPYNDEEWGTRLSYRITFDKTFDQFVSAKLP